MSQSSHSHAAVLRAKALVFAGHEVNEIAALHTAARSYCIDRDAEIEIYDVRLLKSGRLGPVFVTDAVESIVLGAIQLAVEGVVPNDFSSVADLRAFLLTTARTVDAYPIRPQRLTPEEARSRQNAAREAFRQFIEGLSTDALPAVELHAAGTIPPAPFASFRGRVARRGTAAVSSRVEPARV